MTNPPVPDEVVAMLANGAPLAVVGDALEEMGHPWAEMVRAFDKGQPWVERHTLHEIDMLNLSERDLRSRFRFGRRYGVFGRRYDQPWNRSHILEVAYNEVDLRAWAAAEWDRRREDHSYNMVTVEKDGFV